MKDKTKQDDLLITKNQTNLTNLSIEELGEVSKDLVKSSLIPHDNEQDVIAAILLSKEMGIAPMAGLMLGKKLNKKSIFSVIKGKALGIDPVTAIENLHYINDNSSSTGIHIITGLALKAGVVTKIIKDFKPVYGYKTKEGGIIKKDDLDTDFHQIVNKNTKKEDFDVTKLPVVLHPKPVDYVTEIEFKRNIKQPDGSYKEMILNNVTYYSEFSHLHNKDNWKQNTKVMLRNRNNAIGYRAIADDVLNGIYDDAEIADTMNISYKVDKNGNIDFKDKKKDIEEVEVIDED